MKEILNYTEETIVRNKYPFCGKRDIGLAFNECYGLMTCFSCNASGPQNLQPCSENYTIRNAYKDALKSWDKRI